MGEFEYSLMVQAAPDALFAFVADVGTLPTYLPFVRHAESPSHGRARIWGTVGGQSREIGAYILADYELRRLEWGTDGDLHYRGWLHVIAPDGANSSRLTIHLSFAPARAASAPPARRDEHSDAAISGELEQAARAIQRIVERRRARTASESRA